MDTDKEVRRLKVGSSNSDSISSNKPFGSTAPELLVRPCEEYETKGLRKCSRTVANMFTSENGNKPALNRRHYKPLLTPKKSTTRVRKHENLGLTHSHSSLQARWRASYLRSPSSLTGLQKNIQGKARGFELVYSSSDSDSEGYGKAISPKLDEVAVNKLPARLQLTLRSMQEQRESDTMIQEENEICSPRNKDMSRSAKTEESLRSTLDKTNLLSTGVKNEFLSSQNENEYRSTQDKNEYCSTQDENESRSTPNEDESRSKHDKSKYCPTLRTDPLGSHPLTPIEIAYASRLAPRHRQATRAVTCPLKSKPQVQPAHDAVIRPSRSKMQIKPAPDVLIRPSISKPQIQLAHNALAQPSISYPQVQPFDDKFVRPSRNKPQIRPALHVVTYPCTSEPPILAAEEPLRPTLERKKPFMSSNHCKKAKAIGGKISKGLIAVKKWVKGLSKKAVSEGVEQELIKDENKVEYEGHGLSEGVKQELMKEENNVEHEGDGLSEEVEQELIKEENKVEHEGNGLGQGDQADGGAKRAREERAKIRGGGMTARACFENYS